LPEGAPADPLTGHNYDGIQEYDNPLPGWWKWLFVATIALAPPYLLYYHGGAEGRSLEDRYDAEFAAHLQLQFAEIGNLPLTRESVIKFTYDDSWLKVGSAVFKTHCTSCHGKDALGAVGPNLRDEEYKNIKDIGDILTVIQNGANGGAMPAWKTRLQGNELVLVASYVASLRGTAGGAGKAPEGRKIAPWPEPPAEEEAAESGESGESAESGGAAEAKQPAEAEQPAEANTAAEPQDADGV
jgi:cytochrome c oxidase cbb3-type subunit 3